MGGASDTRKVPQIHGRYLRYMGGASDTWEVPQIHGRCLRYMGGASDTWEVPQIHRRCLRYMEYMGGTQIHGRCLRYMEYMGGTQTHGRYLRYMECASDTWKVPQIHGRCLRYMEGTSDTRKAQERKTAVQAEQQRDMTNAGNTVTEGRKKGKKKKEKKRGVRHCCFGQCRSSERCPDKYKGIAMFSHYPRQSLGQSTWWTP